MTLSTDLNYLRTRIPKKELIGLSEATGLSITSKRFAEYLDEKDPISFLQKYFHYPSVGDQENESCVYFCGNSLGLQPRSSCGEMLRVYDRCCSEDDFDDDDMVIPMMAKLVGAKTDEIAMNSSLTVNIHFLMISFYQPTPERHKILIEAKAFPSDHYVTQSQIRYNSFCPETSLITMEPREGESYIRTEDILDLIDSDGDSIALVLLPGVQYYTGQLFDIKRITEAAHKKGCIAGFDLAHAVGNVDLSLNEWNVDFAVWCTYKYLNSGPGCVGGLFVHETHADVKVNRFLGKGTDQVLTTKAKDYVLSPPCPLLLSNVRCSMDVFSKTSIEELRCKSFYLTGYLQFLIEELFPPGDEHSGATISILTPSNFSERGAQLSLVFSVPVTEVNKEIAGKGIFCDLRSNVMRVAPAPMYCRFVDVYRFATTIHGTLRKSVNCGV